MAKKLRIIGLGRCVIGHIAKSLNEKANNAIEFKHHYMVNYETVLQLVDKKVIQSYNNVASIPSFYDQWCSLEEMQTYDICLIELFPPSIPYLNEKENVFACFDFYSQELKNIGFELWNTYKFRNYLLVLKELIQKIKDKKENIKIILVNGELLVQEDMNFIGSMELYKLIEEIKNSDIFLNQNQTVKLLDINEVMKKLEIQKITAYEMEFPYLYLRRLRNSNNLVVSRDCKHSTPILRLAFLQELVRIVTLSKFSVNIEFKDIEFNSIVDDSLYDERAKNYILKLKDSSQNILDFSNAKEFSLAVSYTLATKDEWMIEKIKYFIETFSMNYMHEPADLKNKFYYIRTIAAFLYDTKIFLVESLSRLGVKILSFEREKVREYDNFVLLWLNDIATVDLYLTQSYDNKDNKEVKRFFDLLIISDYSKDYKDLDGCLNKCNINK